jgi:hypothetical protein
VCYYFARSNLEWKREVKCCMPNARITKNTELETPQFAEEIQAAVRTELDKMLAAPYFAQSQRCRRFLSHVVQQTLSGNARQLKERTIGISVFERAIDYDTGEDAIVRVTANEVRKRIGQFYQESHAVHPIQIELPRGSYVPEFRIRPFADRGDGEEVAHATASTQEHADTGGAVATAEPHVAAATVSANPASKPDRVMFAPPGKRLPRVLWLSAAFLIGVIATVAVVAQLWRLRTRSEVPDPWEAFEQSRVPVLVCLGTHDLPYLVSGSAGETEDVVMREDTIPIDDVSVISSMARQLGNKGIPFRVSAADKASLTDLQTQPVIFVGAVDNRWTLELTRGLRYRIDVAYPSGTDKPPIATIVDAEHPSTSKWRTDFSVPLTSWKTDYAIVAREDDATIGVPVLIEAGLGNTGSLAASEFVMSGAFRSVARDHASCRNKSNFEAVIGTDIIGTRPGPPHVLSMTCW